MDGKLLKKLDWRKGKSIWFSLRWIWILLRPALFSLRRILFSLRLAWIPHGEEEIAESFYIPLFHGPETISHLAFLEQYGTVLNLGDLGQRDELFENWSAFTRRSVCDPRQTRGCDRRPRSLKRFETGHARDWRLMIGPKVVHAVRYVMPRGLVGQIRRSEAARRPHRRSQRRPFGGRVTAGDVRCAFSRSWLPARRTAKID